MIHSVKRKQERKTKKSARKTYRRKGGGKTFASSTPVSLSYNGEAVKCDLCGYNHYTENIGTLGKSKMRSGVTSFFFGEVGEVLDTTSIITYFCNKCGLSKTIRNNDDIKIVSGPVIQEQVQAQAPVAPVQAQAPEEQRVEQPVQEQPVQAAIRPNM